MIGSTCKRPAIAGVFLFVFGAAGMAQAQIAETVLCSFQAPTDPAIPNSGVVRDAGGNLYGTTQSGGADGLGALYKVDAAGNETTLYSFSGGNAGVTPSGGLILDSAGNLYGTAEQGGRHKDGLVFKLGVNGQYTVLYNFAGGAGGKFPYNGVTLDSAGNLYGTTHQGGISNGGIVFKIDTKGRETVLYRFPGGASGLQPSSGVILDGAGNLYGVTRYGGTNNHGVVYKLDAAGNESVLHSFTNLEKIPSGNLAMDSAGNLYGTTYGTSASSDKGTVYMLNAAGQETVLHRFHGGTDGANPVGGVALDADGNLYGVTYAGGKHLNGLVYKLTSAGRESVLHSFNANTDGENPNGVILDPAGNLYGTTRNGGPDNFAGTVFLLDPQGKETVLHVFLTATNGAFPRVGVVLDVLGDLYGTTAWGGNANGGVVYKVDPAGRETVLRSPAGSPSAGLGTVALDSAGNLYGTAEYPSSGIVWKVNAAGGYQVLYTFQGVLDTGLFPSGVVVDSAGNLYGTAQGGASNQGVVYKLDPEGGFTLLHTFTGAEGSGPNGVSLDPSGNLYGTTTQGGTGSGTLYELDTAGNFSVLHTFTGGADGGSPNGPPAIDPAGNLYGTASEGGAFNLGTLYELDAAGDFTVLHTFTAADQGPPEFGGTLALDAEGNLYGANDGQWGLVYRFDTSGNLTVLYTFTGGADGSYPTALTLDSAGDLYGTTEAGGEGRGGVVFKLSGVAAAKPDKSR